MNRHLQTAANLKNPKNGFTIVETLVAIAILMIAIAGPLVVANKSLTAALYAKDYAIGSFLAQEGVELIRNFKDNGTGVFAFNNLKTSGCIVNSQCKIDINTVSYINGCVPTNPNTCPLYVNYSNPNNIGYTYTAIGTKTIFARSFYVESVGVDEIKVVVTVSWKAGTVYNDVIINNQVVENGL